MENEIKRSVFGALSIIIAVHLLYLTYSTPIKNPPLYIEELIDVVDTDPDWADLIDKHQDDARCSDGKRRGCTIKLSCNRTYTLKSAIKLRRGMRLEGCGCYGWGCSTWIIAAPGHNGIEVLSGVQAGDPEASGFGSSLWGFGIAATSTGGAAVVLGQPSVVEGLVIGNPGLPDIPDIPTAGRFDFGILAIASKPVANANGSRIVSNFFNVVGGTGVWLEGTDANHIAVSLNHFSGVCTRGSELKQVYGHCEGLWDDSFLGGHGFLNMYHNIRDSSTGEPFQTFVHDGPSNYGLSFANYQEQDSLPGYVGQNAMHIGGHGLPDPASAGFTLGSGLANHLEFQNTTGPHNARTRLGTKAGPNSFFMAEVPGYSHALRLKWSAFTDGYMVDLANHGGLRPLQVRGKMGDPELGLLWLSNVGPTSTSARIKVGTSGAFFCPGQPGGNCETH